MPKNVTSDPSRKNPPPLEKTRASFDLFNTYTPSPKSGLDDSGIDTQPANHEGQTPSSEIMGGHPSHTKMF
jgi:hypothetical protein